jgi:hypothetical protein
VTKEQEKIIREGAEILADKGYLYLEDSLRSLRLHILNMKAAIITEGKAVKIGEDVLAKHRGS